MALLIKLAAIFVSVYLVVTPATVLQPAKVSSAVFYEMKHYATGHGGHTVGRGLAHMWRMCSFFATVLFSPYLPVALFFFILAIIGIATAVARNWREEAVLLVFPVSYFLYFGTQRAMVVRNLLAVAPFLAIAAAHGAVQVARFIAGTHGTFPDGSIRRSWRTTLWAGLLVASLCLNASWLIASAESVRERHTDRFVREAGRYIRSNPDTKFLLSPRVKREIESVEPSLQNITAEGMEADIFMLYAREGMRRWHDWPANHRGLTQAVFGAREVNFDMYPNWWGDDRIIALSRRRAEEIGLHIAGISADTPLLESAVSLFHTDSFRRSTGDSGPPHRSSWSLPQVDPRVLLRPEEAGRIMGPIERGPANGGWDLDGTAATFIGKDGTVASIAVISTSAFDLERHNSEGTTIPNIGVSAYLVPTVNAGDVRLFARSHKMAVIAHVSLGFNAVDSAIGIASQFAQTALDRLGNADPQADRQ